MTYMKGKYVYRGILLDESQYQWLKDHAYNVSKLVRKLIEDFIKSQDPESGDGKNDGEQ